MISLTFSEPVQVGSFSDPAYGLLLGVEAAFVASVDHLVVMEEPNMCIVELRQWLHHWLTTGADEDFVYTSIEAEEEGLLTFRRVGATDCAVGSAWSPLPFEPVSSWDSAIKAARSYVHNVDEWVQKNLGLNVTDAIGDLR